MRAKLLILVILAGVIGYFGYRYWSRPAPTPPAEPPVLETEPESPPPVKPTVAETKVPRTANAIPTTRMTNRPGTVATEPAPEWNTKLKSILGSNANPAQKVQQLKEFLAGLPDPDAEQAVQALTLSVSNEAFGFIKPLVVDPTLPEPVRDEFMVDVLNRPNSIRVPIFLELARNPDHPDNEDAYDMLEIFTNQKLGADWAAWDKAVPAWLKENPDNVKNPKVEPANE